jgi:non-heme chloroperoxidase
MPFVTVGQENSGPIDLYYEDHGTGRPVVLIHGFPLSGASWEKQVPALLDAGYRVITYDRRGFGRSSKPTVGYEYDTLTADLKTLVDTLELDDFVLTGFSMGTGEVVRYLSRYGSERVAKAAMFAPLGPYLLRTDDNPEGVPGKVFDDQKQAIRHDRFAYLKSFLDSFYNVDTFHGSRISDQAWQGAWNVATEASPTGTLLCIDAWCTDFRGELSALSSLPLLVVQGSEDRILPIDNTGRRLPALIQGIQYHEVPGAPHNIGWTHAEVLNPLFLAFLAQS